MEYRPSMERLLELFFYCKENGKFIRRIKTAPNAMPGMVAGGISNHGYIRIHINGRMYLAHVLAWFIVTGEWPECQIDHIDGNRLNNSFLNLRKANQSQNNENQRHARSNNSSGLLGVSRRKDTGRWRATIKHNGRQVTIGNYDTPDEAHAAYLSEKRRLHEFCTI